MRPRSWGQCFLKYPLANPALTAVIPGTANGEHMRDNFNAGRGRLPDVARRQRMARLGEREEAFAVLSEAEALAAHRRALVRSRD